MQQRRVYEVEFFKKETDERGRVQINWCGTVEVTMYPSDTLTVAAKAFRHAPARCQNAHKIRTRRVA